ncbi:hypothetical protein [Pseudomonas alloputida]|nr:hypothetical protein [Pseudomonas alloputida]
MTIKLLRSLAVIGLLGLLVACGDAEPKVSNDSAGHGHAHD